MRLSRTIAGAVCLSLLGAFAANLFATVGVKSGGSVTVVDDLSSGSTGSSDLGSGSIKLVGSLGQVGSQKLGSGAVALDGGYFPFGGGSPTKLAFITPPHTVAVSSCSPQVTVQSQDSSGSPSPVTAATVVDLSSNSSTLAFYSDSTCAVANRIYSVNIAISQNSQNFYFKDTTVGSPNITASGGSLASANQVHTISGGGYTVTVTSAGAGTGNITSTPGGINCGNGYSSCSAAFPPGTNVTLTSSPANGSVFAGWGGYCGGTGSCIINNIQSNKSVTANFSPAPAKLAFLTPPQFVSVGACSPKVTVQAQNSGGGAAPVPLATVVELSTTSSTMSFYYDSYCTSSLTSLNIAVSQSEVDFYFKDSTVGLSSITVSASGLAPATQGETISGGGGSFGLVISTAGTGVGNVTNTTGPINCGSSGAVCFSTATANSVVTLTATTGPGSYFVGWSGGGCTGASTCLVTMDAAKNVTATFSLFTYNLTVSVAGSGAGNVSNSSATINCGNGSYYCSNYFNAGSTVTLTTSAPSGSTFAGWSGVCTGSGACSVVMDAARNVTATFNASGSYSLSVSTSGTGAGKITSTPAGIDCGDGGTSCSSNFASGTQIYLNYAAGANSSFGGWAGAGCPSFGSCNFFMYAPQNVNAIFNPTGSGNVLTVTNGGGSGYGNVTSSPYGINCGNGGTFCSVSFSSSTTVTLTASAGSGSSFTGWGNPACPGTGSCVLSMSVAQNVSPQFGSSGYNLTVSNAGTGSGSITSSPAGISCGNGATSCSSSFSGSVTLTAAPGAGSTFSGWSGAGCSGTGACVVSMNAAQYVTATYYSSAYSITISTGGSGSGSVTSSPTGINCGNGGTACVAAFGSNASVTLTAAAAGGSIFTGWTGGGCAGTSSTCTVPVNSSQYITATFNPSGGGGFNLTVSNAGSGVGNVLSSPAGINCGNGQYSCSASYSAAVTLTAAPAAGSTFAGWSGGCTGTGSCNLPMTSAQTVTAMFNQGTLALTVSKTGTGTGNILSNPTGINCGSAGNICTANFSANTSVSLSATPSSTSFFGGWTGACSGTGSCNIYMSGSAQSATASFNPAAAGSGFILSISNTGSGAGNITSAPAGINCGNGGTSCSASFSAGTSVTLTATPNSGVTFKGWGGGGCAGTGSCTVNMSIAQYVSATFDSSYALTIALTLSNAGSYLGTVTSSPPGINCGDGGTVCSANFNGNSVVTLTATPDSKAVFGGWTGGGCVGSGACSVTMSAAQSITASFNDTVNVGYPISVTNTGTGVGTVYSSPAGINCGTNCSVAFDYNQANITLTATPGANSAFGGWTGAGCSGLGSCVLSGSGGAKNVSANFTPTGGHTLTVSNSGTGGGNIYSTPAGINCGNGSTSCSASFSPNTVVTLNATSNAGAVFKGWNVPGCAGSGSCSITMNAAQYVDASFTSVVFVTGDVAYSGTQYGPVRVEFWSDSAFSQRLVAVQTLPSGAGSYSVSLPGGGFFFIRTFMDLNGNYIPDLVDPRGVYSPRNAGPEPLATPSSGTVSGINITIKDPGTSVSGGVVGEGTAQISNASVSAGSVFSTTVTYVSISTGIQTGGKIGVSLPPGFYAQSVVANSTSATASLSSMGFFGPAAFVTVTGDLKPGQKVNFVFSGVYAPCLTSAQTLTVASAQNGSAPPQPLFAGSPSLTVSAGSPTLFQPANPYFSLTQSQLSSAQTLEARDNCGNKAPVVALTTVTLRAKSYSYASGQFADDATVGLTSATAIATAQSVNIYLGVGKSSANFYAISTSVGMKNIEILHYLNGPATFYANFTVLGGNALGNVSVSTAPSLVGQSAATIIANGDPTVANQAYINFTMGDSQSWHVLVSSVPLGTSDPNPIWESWGYGQPGLGAISWNGRYSPWINFGSRVPNGKYYIRVEVGSLGGIHNDTLSVTVNTPQLSGTISDSAGLPLSNARLQVYGPSGGGYALSSAQGAYAMPGLQAGIYNLFLTRDGYIDGQISATLNSSGAVSTFTVLTSGLSASTNSSSGLDIAMTAAPILYVFPSLVGYSTSSVDQWGSLQVVSSGSTRQSIYGPLRLPAGTTTFDDGGQWDSGTQKFVASTLLKFKVGVGSYTVTANFVGFSPSSASVHVGANGATLNLPAFASKGSISGTVTVPSNPNGMYVSINASPLSTSTLVYGGFGGVFLDPAVTSKAYTVANLDAGDYVLRANAPGIPSATLGPVTVAAGAAVTGKNLSISAGSSITGSVAVNANTTGKALRLFVNAWAPGSFSFGSTVVYASGGNNISVSYAISGLNSGTTYQIYASLDGTSEGHLNVLEGLPLTAAAPSSLNFTFGASSGAITGALLLPSGSVDFGQVDMYAQVVASLRPERVGYTFSVISSTNMPGFACTANLSAAPAGNCPVGNSSATFSVGQLETETYDMTFLYRTTGQTSKKRLSVVNGSTTTLTVDLAAQTFSISGEITNQVTHSAFNTNANIFANAPELPLLDASGNPVSVSALGVPRSTASLARVIAVRQDISKYSVALSTSFDPSSSRVGFLTSVGTYTIANVPPGVYLVRTAGLSACATCAVVVPAVGQVVRVDAVNRSSINFTLTSGHSVSGTISLDDSILDSDAFTVTVLNRRQEVVASTTVYLGDVNLSLAANSVDYSFANLPAGDFYTLAVKSNTFPAKYAGKPIKFPQPSLSPNGLRDDLTSQNVVMELAAYLVGRLQDVSEGVQINHTNASVLAPNFTISATANPWVEGGYVVAASSVSGRPIQADGYFRVGPLIPGIPYDLNLGQTSWDPAYLAQGSQNYTPIKLGGLIPQPGEKKDVGVLNLSQGQSLTGTVRQSTATGMALGNIKIIASPSFGSNTQLTIQTYTNPQGRYTLWVSTAISNQFDITAAPRDGNLAANGLVYGQVTKQKVSLLATTTADFLLEPLLQSVTGQVVVADAATGGELSYPFGANKGFPSAAVFLQPKGVVPTLNPLGDIQATTDESGKFQIFALSTGTYLLKTVSLGYSVYNATVTTTAAGYRIYTGVDTSANYLAGNVITLSRGASLSGRILKSDGTAPNDGEVGGIAAGNFAQGEFVVGNVDIDPVAKTVNSYHISGFKPGVSYNVVLLPKTKGDDTTFPPEGSGISFSVSEATTTKNIDFTYVPQAADCQATAKALGNSQFQVKVKCSQSLRNTLSSDSDLETVLTVSTFTSKNAALTSPNGTGQLLGSDKVISSDRRQITAIYRAVTNEKNFSLRLRAYLSSVDSKTGSNFYVDKAFDFFIGLDSNVTQKISNIEGGSLELEPSANDEATGFSERASIDLQPGTFAEGTDDATAVVVTSQTINLSLSKGKDQKLAKTLSMKALGYVPQSLEVLDQAGAYPEEMAAAMKAYRAMDTSSTTVGGVNPLSSFYSIFLPATIRHQLKQKADLTLSYTLLASGTTDVNKINVWFYNATLDRYVMESVNRRIDTVNNTITVSVDHFSTFVVLDSTPVVTAVSTFATNEILAVSFPNPADCIIHSNVPRNAVLFGAAGTHSPFPGPMIRYTLPVAAVNVNETKINIYNVAGELIRTISQGPLAGGQTYYYPWDCGNMRGDNVASGVYIGEVVWGGRRKFFKMAIIKGSGL